MMKRMAAAALVAGVLAGCGAVPPSAPQRAPLKTGAPGLAGKGLSATGEKWWTAFGDPQLDRLIDRALAGGPTLAQTLVRLRAAQAAVSSSRAATDPKITFGAQDQGGRPSADYVIPPPFGGTTQWLGAAQANLAWSLDLFSRQAAEIAKAKTAAGADRRDAAAARLALAGATTQAYVALARAYVLTDVAQDAVNQRQGIATLTAARVRKGIERSANAKVAETQAAGARVDLVRSKALREIAIHEIAALVGGGANTVVRPKLDLTALAVPDTLPTDLLARRADIAAALARIDTASTGRDPAHKTFYPDFNLAGRGGAAAIVLTPLFTGSALQYGVGPAVDLPTFDAGSLRARYGGSTAQLDRAVADYNAAVVSAVRDAANALSDLRNLRGQAGDLARMRASADDGYRLAEQRYESGLSPQIAVLNAQDIRLQARRQEAALSTDMVAARVALIMALGGGFTPAAPSQEQ